MGIFGKGLTKKQRDFAEEYIKTGNGTRSALRSYDVGSHAVANQIAQLNLKKPAIREYIESRAQPAANMIFELSQFAEAEIVRLNASKDILDRAGYMPIVKTQNVSLEVKGNIEDFAKLDDVRSRFKEELRQKLIEPK